MIQCNKSYYNFVSEHCIWIAVQATSPYFAYHRIMNVVVGTFIDELNCIRHVRSFIVLHWIHVLCHDGDVCVALLYRRENLDTCGWIIFIFCRYKYYIYVWMFAHCVYCFIAVACTAAFITYNYFPLSLWIFINWLTIYFL